jgi:hypothetical protein
LPTVSIWIVLRAPDQNCRAGTRLSDREVLYTQSDELGPPAEGVISERDQRAISFAREGVRACANQLVTKVLG